MIVPDGALLLTGINGPVVVFLVDITAVYPNDEPKANSTVCFPGGNIFVKETVKEVVDLINKGDNKRAYGDAGNR